MPPFDSVLQEYTATTLAATGEIVATAKAADALITITHNGADVINGTAVTWAAGSNTVCIRAQSGAAAKDYRVEVIYTPPALELDATLSELKIGNLTLTPPFDPEVTNYTTVTGNATNTVMATPADAGASVEVQLDGTMLPDGKATWQEGSNTVTAVVKNGDASKIYTVDVTKT